MQTESVGVNLLETYTCEAKRKCQDAIGWARVGVRVGSVRRRI
jgi:hypothetical protein